MGYKIRYMTVRRRSAGRLCIMTGVFFLLFCYLTWVYFPDQGSYMLCFIKDTVQGLFEGNWV